MNENRKQQLVVPSDRLDVKDLFLKVISRWKLVLLGGVFGVLAAFVVNRYVKDIYQLEAVLNVEQIENPLASSGVSLVVNTFGESVLDVKELVLKSVELNKMAARRLNWEVKYFRTGRLTHVQLYQNSPIEVEYDKNHYQIINIPFIIKKASTGFEISTDLLNRETSVYDYSNESEIRKDSISSPKGKYNYGEWIEGKNYRFRVHRNKEFKLGTDDQIAFVFKSISSIAHANKNQLMVNVSDKLNTTTMRLSARGNNPFILADLINTTVQTLRDHELERKNERARNTIVFIDEQIRGIVSDLRNSELQLETFRAQNLVVDLGAESQELLNQIGVIDDELTENILLQRYYKYVIDFLNNNSQLVELSLPPLNGMEDPVVSSLIEKLVSLNGELSTARIMLNANNPQVMNLEMEITNTREALVQGALNALEHTENIERSIQDRYLDFQKKITKLPAKEQQFINIQRRYETYGRQYESLLEKRAEAGILQASNLPDTQVIDPASAEFKSPVSPNRRKNLLLGLVMGMAFPILIIIILDSLNNKVRSRKDIELMTSIPIIGGIGNYADKGIVVIEKPRSAVTESFRGLIANLNFIIEDFKDSASKSAKIVMVTSSIGGEGKTFMSSNLASAIAATGLKTCLVGVDLRKPKLLINFNLENDIGLSSFLTDSNMVLPQIIKKTQLNSLDVIGSGSIPPNPAELLGRSRFDDFLNELKEIYDVVILDTPPIGLVADALNILPKVDGTIYVTRHNYTQRALLGFINDQFENGLISNIGIILNDVKNTGAYGYDSGYGYGYGYRYGYGGYGYLNDEGDGYHED
jgi:capsular exopolysaccharide synthesis family protein